MGVPDIVLLYRTLVADGGLPSGYEKEISTLGPVLESAAERQDRRIRELSNMEASILLKQRKGTGREERQRCKDIGGSVLSGRGDAASQVYVTSATQPLCGPDSPEGCRRKGKARWVEVLGAMLVHTPTPMGKMLGEKPSSLQLLGAGRRASTLRSRVRAVRRYLNWLALNHDTDFPSELEHVTGYLQARQSEPCTRIALRGAHVAPPALLSVRDLFDGSTARICCAKVLRTSEN